MSYLSPKFSVFYKPPHSGGLRHCDAVSVKFLFHRNHSPQKTCENRESEGEDHCEIIHPSSTGL
jgi:hypothetical protein